MPIHSVQLFVTKQQLGNQLTWKIIASQATGIEVQKSKDGNTFTSLTSLPYSANNRFTDAVSIGKNYYRLRITDLDCNSKFSNIVVANDRSMGTFQVYPTIVRETINFKTDMVKQYQYKF